MMYCSAQNFDVLVIGDEISTHYMESVNWIELVKEKSACPLQIYNSSKAGATTVDGYTSLKRFLDKHKTKVAVIELGSNDMKDKKSLSRLEKNLNALIKLSKDANIQVVLLGVELPPQYGTIYRQMLKSTFERTASHHAVELVLTDYNTDPNLVDHDGFHPNADGHKAISNSIISSIEKLACL